MPIFGSVQITGFIAPTSSGDTYATHDAYYGRDGLRNVDLESDLDSITDLRRKAGMIVGVSGGTKHYRLLPEPWSFTFSDWDVAFLTPSNISSYGVGNRWHVPYGVTVTVPYDFQTFIYGDLYVEGTIDVQTNGQLVVLNGNIIMSGGSIVGSGTTYVIQLPDFDTKVTNLTLSGDVLTVIQNDLSSYSVTLPIFNGGSGNCITDLYVTNIHGCSPITVHDNLQNVTSTANGLFGISFGSNNINNSDFSTIAGGSNNTITSYNGATSPNNFIGGGIANVIYSYNSNNGGAAIGGGANNYIYNATYGTIAGGLNNRATNWSSVGGGRNNQANQYWSTIAGGQGNIISHTYSVIGGGNGNHVTGQLSFIGGGDQNINDGIKTVIGGGGNNTVTAASLAGSIVGGIGNIVTGAYGLIGNGNLNTAGTWAVIGGGQYNQANGKSFIGNGGSNIVTGELNTIVTGYQNRIYNNPEKSFIGTGLKNYIYTSNSSIVTGYKNKINAPYSTIVNGSYNITYVGSEKSFIGNGRGNQITGPYSTIINCDSNKIYGGSKQSFIGGGYNNRINGGTRSFIGGGFYNKTYGGNYTFIGNGYYNYVYSSNAFIGTGRYNVIGNNTSYATILNGQNNNIGGVYTNTHIIGSNITANKSNFTFVNSLNIYDVPQSGDTATDGILTRATDGEVKIVTSDIFSKTLIYAYGIPNTEKIKLEDTNNWTINGFYTGSTITNTYQGQKWYDDNYFFEAVGDDNFIRIPRA